MKSDPMSRELYFNGKHCPPPASLYVELNFNFSEVTVTEVVSAVVGRELPEPLWILCDIIFERKFTPREK